MQEDDLGKDGAKKGSQETCMKEAVNYYTLFEQISTIPGFPRPRHEALF